MEYANIELSNLYSSSPEMQDLVKERVMYHYLRWNLTQQGVVSAFVR